MDQTAYTDEQAAYDQFTGLVLDVAGQYGWSAADTDNALAAVDAAHDDADAGISMSDMWGGGGDVKLFWQSLEGRAMQWTGKNADKLRATIRSALETLGVIEANTVSPLDVATGTVVNSVMDVHNAGVAAGNVATSPYFLPALGAVAVAIAVVASRR